MNLAYRVNLYRRYFHWKKANAIFIHVPKVAGTSINKALYGRTLGHYRAIEIANSFPRLFEQAFTFSLVRNPWSRVFSAYQFARMGQTESMGIANPKQYQLPEFETFERFVLEWLKYQDIKQLDFVFQPQYHFLTDIQGKLMINHIGKLESLDTELPLIEENLKRKLSVSHQNKTNQGESFQAQYSNDAMIETIAELYSKDITLFGYQFND